MIEWFDCSISDVRSSHSIETKDSFNRESHLISEFPKIGEMFWFAQSWLNGALQNELMLEGPISHWTMELLEEIIYVHRPSDIHHLVN